MLSFTSITVFVCLTTLLCFLPGGLSQQPPAECVAEMRRLSNDLQECGDGCHCMQSYFDAFFEIPDSVCDGGVFTKKMLNIQMLEECERYSAEGGDCFGEIECSWEPEDGNRDWKADLQARAQAEVNNEKREL